MLGRIVARKRLENSRRRALLRRYPLPTGKPEDGSRRVRAEAALARPAGAPLRVIAEIKLRSPSAGTIRERTVGGVQQVARSYASHGAAAISVLCDRPGFGGTPLDLRRVSETVDLPLLFKEFVTEPMQLDLARAAGASMALLLVNVLTQDELTSLVDAALARDLAPVVEAANAEELARALATPARIIGINARDLRTFDVDPQRAARLIGDIPADRIAVSMSGVKAPAAFADVASGRADAVLIGEGLMRAPDPGARLSELAAGADSNYGR